MPDKRKESLNNSNDTTKSKKHKSNHENDEESQNLAFDPVHFIRSHSKNNDPADIQTQVRHLILFYIF